MLCEPVVSTDHKIFTRSLTCHELKYKSLATVAHCSSYCAWSFACSCMCTPQVRGASTVL